MVVTEVKHQALTKRHVDDHTGTQVWIKHCIFTDREIVNKKKGRYLHIYSQIHSQREIQTYQFSGGEEIIMSFVTSLC